MRPRLRRESGQASVELLGALPALLVFALVAFQLLAVGYAAVLAGNAAEAGALALGAGGDAPGAARAALPGWSQEHARAVVTGGRVEVSLPPPGPLARLAPGLRLRGHASLGAGS